MVNGPGPASVTDPAPPAPVRSKYSNRHSPLKAVPPDNRHPNPGAHDQMTRKIHKRSSVSRTESTNEPRQPRRLEKKRNTHAGCPTGHGPTRGVSGVSGSTLFHMLAQVRLRVAGPVLLEHRSLVTFSLVVAWPWT
jgi:hypothetical protein